MQVASGDGVEEAFDVLGEVNESVRTGLWVGDCFIYTNSVNRINYYVGGEIVTVSHLDRTMYLLGYVANDNRLYLTDKELNIVSYNLQLSVLEVSNCFGLYFNAYLLTFSSNLTIKRTPLLLLVSLLSF